ncbi:putative heme d1 biosynthesis radical SAM protein NirJ2 [Candidatus Contubernalis alkaliaceticus]|uniref:putative heme d1 biosynthesis radical SAM protein NirJ2 n=1 Tax=Candidatus Contubernalis alkaliaceticus TaxID=338645 RepID=UPI001F4C312F|nr:putative heme d1 biosynthesis radical SAM protein NirJ2 [Candidatus Contubernalis alkalaceticus]UNC92947.1 putative heme d1 biosynthesis radical SAM protein NirJ2 [Candidatus Contubernalis alkalaceticus]
MLVSWNTTRQCHLKCKHCYRDAGLKDSDELDTAQGKKLIKDLAAAGFKMIILSGGEPLLRPDIVELTAYARESGLRTVFGTTGTLLDFELAKELKSAGAMCMGISLDSANPAMHDNFRQVPGSWEKAVQGMKNCLQVGLPFQIHTTVVNENFEEFENITDFAVKIGARAHHIFFLVPTGRGKDIEEDGLRQRQYEQLIHRILKKQGEVDIEIKPTCAPQFMRVAVQKGMEMRFNRGCLAGRSYCCILPNGDLHPCPYLPIKLGNVVETDFKTLWQESPVLKDLRQPSQGKCGECRYEEMCGGCRARAYYYSDGDYMAEDPWCVYGK